jgi:hypothetical protein
LEGEAMADGAMGYMFVAATIGCFGLMVLVLCLFWAGGLMRLLARWPRKRKWIIAYGPLVVWLGLCLYWYKTDAPRRWVFEALPETPSSDLEEGRYRD